LQEIDHIQGQVESAEKSGFERAWLQASGENKLLFNFGGMRHNVINAKFGVMEESDDFADNNALQITLNKDMPLNQVELEITLLHESMHYNVTRERAARPQLNDNIDHLALALLGDPNESDNFNLEWLDCPFSRCKSPYCLKYDPSKWPIRIAT